MSVHLSSSALPSHRTGGAAAQGAYTDPGLFTAVALLIAVLVADALLILAAAPSLADLATVYITTT